VLLNTEPLAADEKILKSLQLVYKGSTHSLSVSKDTHMLEGDKGYISFADINFDGLADIAITTSFGLGNLYLDYWVYDSVNNQYNFLGNFSKFTLSPADKTLSNVVKLNAVNYENYTYHWQGLSLVKQ